MSTRPLNTQKKPKKWDKLPIRQTKSFSLFRSLTRPGIYEVSWKKLKGYGRKRFNAKNDEEAEKEAPKKAGLVAVCRHKVFAVSDSFTEALKDARRRPRSQDQWWYYVEKFLAWLEKAHPECTHWHLLDRQIVREYLDTLKGKADNTIRLELQPVRQTSAYMSREHNLPNFAEKLGVGSDPVHPPATVYLSDVLDFLDWLMARQSNFEAGAALQGLAGLRVTEVIRLTWDKVDLEKGLVEVSGLTKNLYSERVIPVARRVQDALLRLKARKAEKKVRPIHQAVLTDTKENPFATHDVYGRGMRKAIRAWIPKIGWAPKDLRNCLPTFSINEKVRNEIWRQYEGRRPETVEERHYIARINAVSRGEQEELERRMGIFRSHVIEPLESAIESTLAKREQGKKKASGFRTFLNTRGSTV